MFIIDKPISTVFVVHRKGGRGGIRTPIHPLAPSSAGRGTIPKIWREHDRAPHVKSHYLGDSRVSSCSFPFFFSPVFSFLANSHRPYTGRTFLKQPCPVPGLDRKHLHLCVVARSQIGVIVKSASRTTY